MAVKQMEIDLIALLHVIMREKAVCSPLMSNHNDVNSLQDIISQAFNFEI